MNLEHTDLALEAKTIWENSSDENTMLEGVTAGEVTENGYRITTVEILNEKGSEILCKPIGKYVTVDLEGLLRREDGSFEAGTELIAGVIRDMLPSVIDGTVLVAGLGNRAITPDRIGPEVADGVLATRHLVMNEPGQFPFFNRVSVIAPGVLGTTGIESGDLIKTLAEELGAECVIAVDALCSAGTERLCRTVQITDTGITPGSGVGNARSELNDKTLGVPVIAVGVPTVMTVYSAATELFGEVPESEETDRARSMIVTPRDIDVKTKEIAKTVSYALNMALHNGLSVGDIDMLI